MKTPRESGAHTLVWNPDRKRVCLDCRTQQPDDQNPDAPHDSVDTVLQQEVGKPVVRALFALRVLQFLPNSQVAESHACDGCRDRGPRLECARTLGNVTAWGQILPLWPLRGAQLGGNYSDPHGFGASHLSRFKFLDLGHCRANVDPENLVNSRKVPYCILGSFPGSIRLLHLAHLY